MIEGYKYWNIQSDLDAHIKTIQPEKFICQGYNLLSVIRSTILALMEKRCFTQTSISPSPKSFIKPHLLRALSWGLRKKAHTKTYPNVIFFCDASAYQQVGNTILNRFFDSFTQEMEASDYSYESWVYGKNSSLDPMSNPHTKDMKPAIRAAMAGRPIKLEGHDNIFDAISGCIASIHRNIDENDFDNIQARCLENCRATLLIARYFSSVFVRNKPSALVGVNYYNPVGWGLNLAANKAGISTFEIQHGVQGPAHHAYNGSISEGLEPLPRHYLCWTDEAANHAKRRGYDATVIGPSWYQTVKMVFKNQTYSSLSTELIMNYAAVKKQQSEHAQKIHLLYVGQNGIPVSNSVRDLAANHNIKIWSAPRAGFKSTSPFPQLFDQTIPMPFHIAAVDGIITAYSSVAIEAYFAAKPVIFTDPLGKDYFSHYKGLETSKLIDENFIDEFDFNTQKNLISLEDALDSWFRQLPNAGEILQTVILKSASST